MSRAGEGGGPGAGLFREEGCLRCHRLGDAGGAVGPDLTHVGSRLSPALIDRILDNPRSADPRAAMPDPALLPPERAELVAFLGRLE